MAEYFAVSNSPELDAPTAGTLALVMAASTSNNNWINIFVYDENGDLLPRAAFPLAQTNSAIPINLASNGIAIPSVTSRGFRAIISDNPFSETPDGAGMPEITLAVAPFVGANRQ